MENIKHTHYFPCYMIYYNGDNPVENALKSLGGKVTASRVVRGNDTCEEWYSRQFEFWFAEYSFPKEPIKAFVIGEMYPQLMPESKNLDGVLIKVRLGNFRFESDLTKKIAATLGDLSKKLAGDFAYKRAHREFWKKMSV